MLIGHFFEFRENLFADEIPSRKCQFIQVLVCGFLVDGLL